MFKKLKFPMGDRSNRENKKLTMCKKCYSFHYRKVWHFEAPTTLQNEEEPELSVRFSVCPACMEQELALYERESDGFSYGI